MERPSRHRGRNSHFVRGVSGAVPSRLGSGLQHVARYFGEAAGLDFKQLRRTTVKGIEGDGISAHKGTLKLRIGNWQLPPIPCIDADSDRTPLLIEREGFFDLCNIILDNRRKRVVLERLA